MRAPCSPPWVVLLFAVSFTLLFAFASPSAAAEATVPEIAFEGEAVVVSAAPGARVALFGVGRLSGTPLPAQVRFAELLDIDGLGAARYESAYGVPTWSVWAAVDLASGEVAVAAPAGGELRWREVPRRALRAELDGLDETRRFLELLLVRPESAPGASDGAAWSRGFGDGGEGDDDGATDGKVRVAPWLLDPLGDAPAAPSRFAPGDVLVAVDPDTLEAWTASVPGR